MLLYIYEQFAMSLHLFVFCYFTSVVTTMSKQQRYWQLKKFNITSFKFNISFCTHCFCSHMYFCCSHHKQLNSDLKGITFVVLAIHEQVAPMSSSSSKTRLLPYADEHLANCAPLFYIYYVQTIVLFSFNI